MKKKIIIICTIITLVLLVACGEKEDDSSNKSDSKEIVNNDRNNANDESSKKQNEIGDTSEVTKEVTPTEEVTPTPVDPNSGLTEIELDFEEFEYNGVSGYSAVAKKNYDADDMIGYCVKIPSEHNGKPVIAVGRMNLNTMNESPIKGVVDIPDSVMVIDECAFYKCTEIEEIIMHDGVEEIKSEAIKYCTKLNKITLPNTLKKISGIDYCDSLTELVIPDSVEDPGAFYPLVSNCNGLERVVYPSKWTNLPCVGNGPNIKSIKPSNYIENESSPAIVISDNIQRIGRGTFSDMPESINEIQIPEGVNWIDSCAFENSYFEEVFIPDSVEIIDFRLFGEDKQCHTKKVSISSKLYKEYESDIDRYIYKEIELEVR